MQPKDEQCKTIMMSHKIPDWTSVCRPVGVDMEQFIATHNNSFNEIVMSKQPATLQKIYRDIE